MIRKLTLFGDCNIWRISGFDRSQQLKHRLMGYEWIV